MSNSISTHPIATPSPRLRPLAVAIASALCLMIGPGSAWAFNPDPPSTTRTTSESLVPPAYTPAAGSVGNALRSSISLERTPTAMQKITERLRRIPLRPVTIGDTPRTPDDPEPGAGVTVFIRF